MEGKNKGRREKKEGGRKGGRGNRGEWRAKGKERRKILWHWNKKSDGKHKYKNIFLFIQSLSRVGLCNPMGLQHARLPCPSPSPEACSNSCPLGQWCHPTISSSVMPPNHLVLCHPLPFLPSTFLRTKTWCGDNYIRPQMLLAIQILEWLDESLVGSIVHVQESS